MVSRRMPCRRKPCDSYGVYMVKLGDKSFCAYPQLKTPTFSTLLKMATPRKKLIKKFSTRGKNGYLSSAERAMIIHVLLSGEKVSTLADRFSCHWNTITNTIKQYRATNSLDTKPRIGTLPRLSIREKRALYHCLWKTPEILYTQLQTWVESCTSKKVSRTTEYRWLISLPIAQMWTQ